MVCCVGTNDCSSDAFSSEEFTSHAEQMIEKLKCKVTEPSNISLSSIPPRRDQNKFQDNVDIANACLESVADKTNVSFINNENTFKLMDGSINDGYLARDGLHLNRSGSNKLASNMKLHKKDEANNDVTLAWRTQQKTKNKQQTSTRDGNRQKVQPRPDHRRIQGNQRQQNPCQNCGESNHATENCRFGRELECYSCKGLGHKAQYCPRRENGDRSQSSEY